MNIPSKSVLIYRDKLIKTVQQLCEESNNAQQWQKAFEVTDTGGLYLMGVGGYDGTNADDPETKTLQQVLEDMQSSSE